MLRFLLLSSLSISVLRSETLERCGCLHSQIRPTFADVCVEGNFMKIVDLYIQNQCDIDDPCGRATPRFIETPDEYYDFIVVGSGSAGSIVASRLSENPEWTVLLIEAGEDEPTATQVIGFSSLFQKTSIDWDYEAYESTNSSKKFAWPRGKVLGGTSVLFGMMYMRGTKEDYNEWEALGNPGWNYENVLQYFKKSEDNAELENEYHGKGGLQSVGLCPYTNPMVPDILSAGVENGLQINDLNGENSTGIMIAQFTQKNGVRRSSARAFLRPARNRNNLHILLNTTVTKVLIENKVTTGVQATDNKGNNFEIRVNKEVIISAGTIGSPQLLLLSGIGPSEDLSRVGVKVNHHLPGVGRNLQDHVQFSITFTMNQSDTNSLDWLTLQDYITNRDGPLASRDMMVATIKIASPYSNGRTDLQYYVYSDLATCSKTGKPGELRSDESMFISLIPILLNPKSRGYIKLNSSDPFQHPIIVGNYLQHPSDILPLLHGVKFALKLGESSALEKFNLTLTQIIPESCTGLEFGNDDFWRCAIRERYDCDNHQVGTCRMGPSSDPMSVVDARLRVHGIDGLRVMDASIMPRIVAGNTHATIQVIAEMGSQFIKDELQ